eukprot:185016-Pyramimonas_sp.AAC.1
MTLSALLLQSRRGARRMGPDNWRRGHKHGEARASSDVSAAQVKGGTLLGEGSCGASLGARRSAGAACPLLGA